MLYIITQINKFGFEMKNLDIVIRDKEKKYKKDIDYKYFTCLKQTCGLLKTCKKVTNELFLYNIFFNILFMFVSLKMMFKCIIMIMI